MSETEVDSLTNEELQVAELLLFEKSCREIGKILDMAHGTAWNIGRRPHVQAYVKRVQEAMEGILTRRAKVVAGVALDTLRDIMEDPKAPPGARVAAAGHALRATITQRHEVTGPNGGPVQSVQIDPEKLAGMSEAELRVLREALVKL